MHAGILKQLRGVGDCNRMYQVPWSVTCVYKGCQLNILGLVVVSVRVLERGRR